MKLIIFLSFFLAQNSQAYLSYGDATDDCTFSISDTSLTQTEFNCDDLIVDAGVTLQWASGVTSVIQFRVQGNVQIDGTIRVSANTNSPGPGGSSGGSGGTGASCNGTGSCDGASGDGTTGGQGSGGSEANDAGSTLANDGGGGGGAVLVVGGSGEAGETGPSGVNTPGSGGSSGTGFVNSSYLDSSLPGGVGGGGGGGGDGIAVGAGGEGGHGSGSLLIVSKGEMTFGSGALIEALGDTGESGSSSGGGNGGDGGSGSGGVVYLVSGETISITAGATVDIRGGDRVTTGSGAYGGKGSDGFLRIDTASGSTTGSFSVTNNDGVGTSSSTTPTDITDPLGSSTTSDTSNEYTSDIEAACNYKMMDESAPLPIYSLMMGMFLMIFLFKFYKFTRCFVVSNIMSVPKS